MNKLSSEDRVRVLACLVEGNSLRATVRMAGIHRTTILRLLVELGDVCLEYQRKTLVNLPCKRVQCDKIWSFVGAKEKNATAEQKADDWGDAWTWVAFDADTKLVPCWCVGTRNANAAYHFIHDLKDRLANRVQLTTDGHRAYLNAVEDAFGCEVDYRMLIKVYSAPEGGEIRYSLSQVTGAVKSKPDAKHISTSVIERQNLIMRMQMRHFTQLSDAFSKKLANHEAAIALQYMNYNFARVHQALRVTPAMEAGVANHVWSIAEIVALLKD